MLGDERGVEERKEEKFKWKIRPEGYKRGCSDARKDAWIADVLVEKRRIERPACQ